MYLSQRTKRALILFALALTSLAKTVRYDIRNREELDDLVENGLSLGPGDTAEITMTSNPTLPPGYDWSIDDSSANGVFEMQVGEHVQPQEDGDEIRLGASGFKVVTITASSNPNPRTSIIRVWNGSSDVDIEVNVAKTIDLRNRDLMTYY